MHGGSHVVGMHLPMMQASPGLHLVLQSPQCCGSFDGSAQPPGPLVAPAGQQISLPVQAPPPLQLQVSLVQDSPILHWWPQAPQLVGLCETHIEVMLTVQQS